MESFEILVVRAQAGDKEAFGQLYSGYFTPIYRFLYWRTKHKETAEDLTQTVFLKAYEAMSAYKSTGAPFLSWLYTIARNLYLDHSKKKKSILPDDPEIFWDAMAQTGPATDKMSHEREDREALAGALAELTDEQQEIVILRFIEERSYEEIAEITDKSKEALRALNYRAMKTMKSRLKKKYKEEL